MKCNIDMKDLEQVNGGCIYQNWKAREFTLFDDKTGLIVDVYDNSLEPIWWAHNLGLKTNYITEEKYNELMSKQPKA